jgi:hypothetical protein
MASMMRRLAWWGTTQRNLIRVQVMLFQNIPGGFLHLADGEFEDFACPSFG